MRILLVVQRETISQRHVNTHGMIIHPINDQLFHEHDMHLFLRDGEAAMRGNKGVI